MTTSAPARPGLYFQSSSFPDESSPLRSDVAGFVGRARRGPVGRAVRVTGRESFESVFGGLERGSPLGYAMRGYFANGGQVAHVIRLAAGDDRTASARWETGNLYVFADPNTPAASSSPFVSAFESGAYRVEASSAGRWAVGAVVLFEYERDGPDGFPRLHLTVRVPGERTEHLRDVELPRRRSAPGTSAATLEEQVAASSRFIRLTRFPGPPVVPATRRGPHRARWRLVLEDGPPRHVPVAAEDASIGEEYLEALRRLGDEREVALLSFPGLWEDLAPATARTILSRSIDLADRLQDRLVLVDPPPETESAASLLAFVRSFRDDERRAGRGRTLRSGAFYFPHLWAPNPLGAPREPRRRVPPSGHVAGVISRLDRERGAHHTPANAPLYGAVDVTRELEDSEWSLVHAEGINPLRCRLGAGLVVWGGQTLHRKRAFRFLAHRRLVHRLVRAIRRVAEPIVFETNGPDTWLRLVRAITTVLLEAFRAGALQGLEPREAFRVRCDEETNPPQDRERGIVICEIDLALAVPMEFIVLRLALSRAGELEVSEG